MSKKHVILYVDDEWANRVVFEENFNDRFRIITATSGAAALQVMEKESVACLVTDQRMPEMSGNELLQRAKDAHPDVVRVVVTAYSDLDPILKAVNDGLVARYIVKPWVKEELEKILDWAVEVFTLGQESSGIQIRLLKSERLITLGSMAGSVLHEIRNLLSSPRSNARYLHDAAMHAASLEKLVSNHGARLGSEARASLQDLATELPSVAEDLTDALQKIQDVLDSYRKVLRETPDGPGHSDPKEAIRYVLPLLRSMAKGIEVSYGGPDRLPRVGIGQTELTQVLLNLGANGVQAFPERATGKVTIVVVEERERVTFAIVDDGPGMPREVLEKVGTSFFTTKEEGTGLGIAACRRLVAKAGGTLSIESAPGKGTTVRFSIPIIVTA